MNAFLLSRVNNGGDMAFHLYDPNQSFLVKEAVSNVFDGQWKVFTVTLSTYRYAVYLDGVPIANGTVGGSGINDRDTIINYLGRSTWANDALAKDMGLRQLAIFKKEMTQAEVVAATDALVSSCPQGG